MRIPPIKSFFRPRKISQKMNGWLALSPLLIFMAVYVVSSVAAHDFYAVPITAAFAIAVLYAIFITRHYETMSKTISIFSDGAGNRNVLLMIWIFVLAGAFASTAKAIGAIDATVTLTLRILPDRLLLVGLFLAACFVSLAIGTSVGTIVALVPLTTAIAGDTQMSVPLLTAVIVGGAFFGDNLSFISDTTIAATQSQGCSMKDKFRVNLYIALPAALIVSAIYIWLGWNGNNTIAPQGTLQPLLILPYLLIIILAVCGVNVVTVLTIGTIVNGILGMAMHTFSWTEWLTAIGNGIQQMGELIIVTMLAGGLLELIRYNGGIEFIIRSLTRRLNTKRGAEFTVAALVSLANICTANNTIAIITVGSIAKDITQKFNLDPRKTASLLDTFSCLIQGIIPYGAQLLMASALAGISSIDIIPRLFYPFVLGIVAILSIILRYPRKYS